MCIEVCLCSVSIWWESQGHHPNTRKTHTRAHTQACVQKTTGVLSSNLEPQAHFKHIPQVIASASSTSFKNTQSFSTSLHYRTYMYCNIPPLKHSYNPIALLISFYRHISFPLKWNLVLLPLYKQPLPGFIIHLLCICWCGLVKHCSPNQAWDCCVLVFSSGGGQQHRPLNSCMLVCGTVQVLLSADLE